MYLDEDGVWTFDNGIQLYKRHILRDQMEQYRRRNLHEPEEERHFTRILASAAAGLVFDVGAGVGYYSILARKLGPFQVRAFNPDPLFVEWMSANLELNGVGQGVVIEPVALDDYTGTARLELAGDYSAYLQRGEGDVPVRRLGDFLHEPVLLAKIDVQGAELRVLQSAGEKLDLVRSLLVATHSEELHHACVHYLSAFGYTIEFQANEIPEQYDGLIVAKI